MNNSSPRIPPHSISAEQSVLGGILLDNPSYLTIAGLLNANDFYREDHQLIFRAMKDMAADNQPLDVLTVSEWMQGRFLGSGTAKRSFFDIIGGLAYLGDLAKDTPSAANIAEYARIVRNYALKRQLIQIFSTGMEQAFAQGSDNETLSDLFESSVSKLFHLEQQKEAANKGFISIKQGVNTQMAVIESLKDNDGSQLLGVASGVTALDQQLSGFEKGKVYVIAGRPAMGKTTLGLNLMEGIATSSQDQGVVAVFSLEMTTGQVVEKMMASQGRVNFSRLRSPWELSVSDWQSLDSGVKKLRGMEVFLDDQATLSPADCRVRCRRLVRETGKPLMAIMIDYVQLMHGSAKQYVNREAEVAAISGEIRALAKDFNCPIILLSQLNRSVESRPNKRPIMSDLRESGALEQDAACVIFIYRDEVYDPHSADKGIAELLIAKHRGGQIGTVRCAFVGKHQRFANHPQQGA